MFDYKPKPAEPAAPPERGLRIYVRPGSAPAADALARVKRAWLLRHVHAAVAALPVGLGVLGLGMAGFWYGTHYQTAWLALIMPTSFLLVLAAVPAWYAARDIALGAPRVALLLRRFDLLGADGAKMFGRACRGVAQALTVEDERFAGAPGPAARVLIYWVLGPICAVIALTTWIMAPGLAEWLRGFLDPRLRDNMVIVFVVLLACMALTTAIVVGGFRLWRGGARVLALAMDGRSGTARDGTKRAERVMARLTNPETAFAAGRTVRFADADWQNGVAALVRKADIVVIDVSMFTLNRQGLNANLAWEIGQVFALVAPSRIIIAGCAPGYWQRGVPEAEFQAHIGNIQAVIGRHGVRTPACHWLLYTSEHYCAAPRARRRRMQIARASQTD